MEWFRVLKIWILGRGEEVLTSHKALKMADAYEPEVRSYNMSRIKNIVLNHD